MTGDELLDALAAVPLLPVLREASAEAAVALAGRLANAGLRALELTTTTPGWQDALRECVARWPDLAIGTGTVTTRTQAAFAVEAGAQFLVSPYPAPEVRPVAAAAGIVFIEGGFTPGEIADAAGRGPAKLFPAHVGGPQYLSSVLAVLPQAQVIPTGGIRLAEVGQWLAAGAVAVGVGSDLTAPGDIADRVRDVLARQPA